MRRNIAVSYFYFLVSKNAQESAAAGGAIVVMDGDDASSTDGVSYFKAGVVFQRGRRHELARRCFKKALAALAENADSDLRFKILWNLSQACLALHDDAGES